VKTCAECGGRLIEADPDNLEEAIGWTKPRKRGIHALRFWKKTGHWMCGRCARARTRTGNALQGAL
jgi:hypothetical protein